MKQIEVIYREILYKAIEEKNKTLTQSELSKNLNVSLSTVNHALKPLKNMGAIKIDLRNFKILDVKKILYYWASVRNLNKDIIYSTRVEMPISKIESNMPNNIVFAAYSAYKFKFKDVLADYSEVYVYGNREDIKKRFPENINKPNLFVLKLDDNIEKYGKTTSIGNTFADLWNLREWYAKEFLKAFEVKIERLLE